MKALIFSLPIFLLLLFVFIALNILDVHSTFLVVSNTSTRSERNPVARFLLRKLGVKRGLVTLKLLLIPILALMVWYYPQARKEIVGVLLLSNFLYLLVVANNYRIHRRIQRRRRLV